MKVLAEEHNRDLSWLHHMLRHEVTSGSEHVWLQKEKVRYAMWVAGEITQSPNCNE